MVGRLNALIDPFCIMQSSEAHYNVNCYNYTIAKNVNILIITSNVHFFANNDIVFDNTYSAILMIRRMPGIK